MTPGILTLESADLPGFWKDADQASARGQRLTLIYSGLRLAGAVMAAIGGLVVWVVAGANVGAAIVVIGIAVSLGSEFFGLYQQPERDWYAGRALAESAKTLAWRFAICADPFPVELDEQVARNILRERIAEVASGAMDRVTIGSETPIVTPRMSDLRGRDFVTRRSAYLEGRTRDQYAWYSKNAARNQRSAAISRTILIVGEVVSLILAAVSIFNGLNVEWAGIVGTIVASIAAWVALKQFTSLSSAYSTAATELAIQLDRLQTVAEPDWAAAAADAEEAISREHTLWLASRTGRLERPAF